MLGSTMMVRRNLLVVALACALATMPAGPALAAAGDLDTAFGGDGKVTTNFSADLDMARAVAIQADGKIVAAGRAGPGAHSQFALARYETDGTLDTSFAGDGKVTTNLTDGTDSAAGMAIQPNGKIVVAGSADGRFAAARYRTDGSLDSAFGGDGTVTTNFPNGTESAFDVALQPDGNIVAAGHARDGGRFAVARYKPNGHLDDSFSHDGRLTTEFEGFELAVGLGVALQANGRIVVAGEAEGPGRFALARYRSNGTLDPAFGGDGKVTTNFTQGFDEAVDVAIQTDGKILAAGTTGEGSDPAFALARYEADGTLDPTFDGDGRVTTQFRYGEDVASGVAVQADGRIVAAGATGEGGPFSRFALARYETDGSLDPTFSGNGKVITTFVVGFDFTIANEVAIQADGNIVAAGSAGGAGGRFALARYLAV
jgi:uncharacterized delta-60 repeat protein